MVEETQKLYTAEGVALCLVNSGLFEVPTEQAGIEWLKVVVRFLLARPFELSTVGVIGTYNRYMGGAQAVLDGNRRSTAPEQFDVQLFNCLVDNILPGTTDSVLVMAIGGLRSIVDCALEKYDVSVLDKEAFARTFMELLRVTAENYKNNNLDEHKVSDLIWINRTQLLPQLIEEALKQFQHS